MSFDAGSIVAKIKADFSGFTTGVENVKKASTTMRDSVKNSIAGMNNGIKSITPTLQKMSVGFAAVAAGGVLMLRDWQSAAAGAQVEMAKFNATLDAIPGITQGVKDGLLQAADAATKLAFDDEEAANVLANFYQRTKDVTEATNLNNVAMDLARKKNIDLTAAAGLVTQVLSGNGKVLKQYGIDIKESATPLEALAQLQGVVGGQADAFMETTIGKSDALKISIGNLKESLGEALLPIMEQWTGILTQVVGWLNQLSPEMKKLIAYVALAITAFSAIAAPLIILITMIPAITAGFAALGTVIAVLTAPISLVIIALGLLFIAWQTNLFGIRDITASVWQSIKDLFTLGGMFIQDAWASATNAIYTVSVTIFESIKGVFIGVINWITEQINSLIRLANGVAKKLTFGSFKGITAIPKLATGGIVTRPTLAMIGEGGQSEAVIPLDRLSEFGGGKGMTLNIYDSLVTDEESAKRIFDMAFRSMNLTL